MEGKKVLRKELQKVLFSLWEQQLKPQLDSENKDNGGRRQREETERTWALIKSSGLLTKSTLRLFLGFPFHFISSFFYLFPLSSLLCSSSPPLLMSPFPLHAGMWVAWPLCWQRELLGVGESVFLPRPEDTWQKSFPPYGSYLNPLFSLFPNLPHPSLTFHLLKNFFRSHYAAEAWTCDFPSSTSK